jgi:hypothetical protein
MKLADSLEFTIIQAEVSQGLECTQHVMLMATCSIKKLGHIKSK